MNNDTVLGYYNLPAKTVGLTTAKQTFTVPAGGVAGTSIPGLPSPALPVGSAISLGLSDYIGVLAFDGHPFKIKVEGIVQGMAASTFSLFLNQNTAAHVGLIGAAEPVTAAGVDGTGANVWLTLFTTVTWGALLGHFQAEVICHFNSTTGRLNSVYHPISALAAAAVLDSPPVWVTGTTSIAVASVSDLNFTLSTTIATAANSTCYVKLNEFSIERA